MQEKVMAFTTTIRRALVVSSTTVAVIVLTAACGSDSTRSGDWDVGEEPGDPVPLRRGVYEVSSDIADDECEPTLTAISGQFDNWPPRKAVVVAGEPGFPDTLRVNLYELRTGWHERLAKVVPELTAYPPVVFDEEWNTLWHYGVDLDCPDNQSQTRYQVVAVSDGVIELRVETNWVEPAQCLSETERDANPYVPQSGCHESYTLIYRLIEECPLDCRLSTRHDVIEQDGFQYTTPKLDAMCQCD